MLHFRHIFKPQNVVCNIFSELTQNASLLFFRKTIPEKTAEKFCVISEMRTNICRKLCVENTLRETKFDKSILLEKSSLRDIWKPKNKLCEQALCWF